MKFDKSDSDHISSHPNGQSTSIEALECLGQSTP